MFAALRLRRGWRKVSWPCRFQEGIRRMLVQRLILKNWRNFREVDIALRQQRRWQAGNLPIDLSEFSRVSSFLGSPAWGDLALSRRCHSNSRPSDPKYTPSDRYTGSPSA